VATLLPTKLPDILGCQAEARH